MRNVQTILNADITREAQLLSDILGLDGITGIICNPSECTPVSNFVFMYNKTYFEHMYVLEEGKDNDTLYPVITPKEGHGYEEKLEGISNIGLNIVGKSTKMPIGTGMTVEAKRLEQLLRLCNNFAIDQDVGVDALVYNDAYFVLVGDILDVKQEYKQYLNI